MADTNDVIIATVEPTEPNPGLELELLQPIHVTDEEFDEAVKQGKRMRVNAGTVKALARVGFRVQKEGAMAFTLGRAVVRQSVITEWLEKLEAIEEDISDNQMKIGCVNTATALIRADLANDQIMIAVVETQNNVSKDGQGRARPRNKSFTPGAVIQLNVNTAEKQSLPKTIPSPTVESVTEPEG